MITTRKYTFTKEFTEKTMDYLIARGWFKDPEYKNNEQIMFITHNTCLRISLPLVTAFSDYDMAVMYMLTLLSDFYNMTVDELITAIVI